MAMAHGLNQGIQAGADTRRTSDMERLSEMIGSNLRTLVETNDRLEGGLCNFQQTPTALEQPTNAVTPPSPPPGTMAYLEYATKRTNEELSRHNDLVNRVRAIF